MAWFGVTLYGAAYAFVHGNWALDNSRPDGRWCGIDAELPRLLPDAQIVVLVVPLTEATRGLVDARFLAALPDGDTLSFTRLQDMIGLTPGNLIIHLRKLEEADYISSEKTGNGSASRTTAALTSRGRAALDAYTQALRDLLGGL